MIDIDDFKIYNDQYGHQRGDDCIIAISACILSIAKRATDMAARYGGEEFVLLLPYTSQHNAVALGEKIRAEIESLNIRNEFLSPARAVTVSIGIATVLPQKDDRFDGMIKNADTALYQAKRLGKNRLHVF